MVYGEKKIRFFHQSQKKKKIVHVYSSSGHNDDHDDDYHHRCIYGVYVYKILQVKSDRYIYEPSPSFFSLPQHDSLE